MISEMLSCASKSSQIYLLFSADGNTMQIHDLHDAMVYYS